MTKTKLRNNIFLFLLLMSSTKAYSDLSTLNADFTECFKSYFCGNDPVEVFVDKKASLATKKKKFFEAVEIKCRKIIGDPFAIKYIESSVPSVFRFEISAPQYKSKVDSTLGCSPPRNFDEIMDESRIQNQAGW